MDDTPAINDGADTSLRKTVSLLNKIEAKTGSTTITGPVTVSNEVEVKNDSGNPVPVNDAGGSLTVDGSVSVSNLPASYPVTDNGGSLTVDGTVGISGTVPVSGTFWQATQPISGTVTATQATAANLNATVVGSGSFTAQQATAANLNATVVQGTATNLKTQAETYQGGSAVSSSNPLLVSLANTSANATAVKVDGSSVTQPTRETQPIGDYVINTSSVASFSSTGSALQSESFDAGVNADYVVFTLSGGGSAAAFYYDLSTNNSTWDLGNAAGGFSTYYDLPATSATDTYSYKSVAATSLFGSTRSAFSGRFIVPLTQTQPGSGVVTTYRYIRLNLPASFGGWRYRFASYKSVDSLIGASIPGNPSTARVTGRVDVGCVTTLPTLSATVTQSTATNLRTQAETYQGGTAVGSANPLQVTLANTGANSTNLNATVVQSTHANLKAQAQILDASGNQLTYAATGTAGTPASDVVTVQGIASGIAVATRPRHAAVSVVTGTTANTNSNSVLAQNTTRQYLLFQNLSDTDMNINFGAAASSSTMLIPKNGGGIVFETGFVPTDAVNLICTAASKAYYILHA